MSYSTEDCKKYLITVYQNTTESGWKRIKKYKDEEKRVARDFEYSDGTIATIIETPEGLQDKNVFNNRITKTVDNKNNDVEFNPFAKVRGTPTPTYTNQTKKISESEKFEQFMKKVIYEKIPEQENQTKSSLDMMRDYLNQEENAKKNPHNKVNDFFDGGSMPSIYQNAILDHTSPIDPFIKAKDNLIVQLLKDVPFENIETYQEKFLYVLVNGTQWQQSDGNKASTDFYFNIKGNEKESFIQNLIQRDIDLPNMYLLHIINTAVAVESCDEGYIPFSVMDGEEALSSMHDILKDIVDMYEKNEKKVVFDSELIEASVYTLESLKQLCSMNEVEEDWEKKDIDEQLDKLINLIKNKSPKKGMKP